MTAVNSAVLETAATEFQRRFHISSDQTDTGGSRTLPNNSQVIK